MKGFACGQLPPSDVATELAVERRAAESAARTKDATAGDGGCSDFECEYAMESESEGGSEGDSAWEASERGRAPAAKVARTGDA